MSHGILVVIIHTTDMTFSRNNIIMFQICSDMAKAKISVLVVKPKISVVVVMLS
jgi:hypothetical protein